MCTQNLVNANFTFAIRVNQCLASQSVSISGTTGKGSAHSHGWGTYKVVGSIANLHAHYRTVSNSAEITNSGALSVGWTSNTYACANTESTKEHQPTKIDLDTSLGGTSGSSGSESAHTHTFSSSATIGSGSYIRPNSRAVLFCIRY